MLRLQFQLLLAHLHMAIIAGAKQEEEGAAAAAAVRGRGDDGRSPTGVAQAPKRYYCDPDGGGRGACLDVREMPGTMAPSTPVFRSASCNNSCPNTLPHRCESDWDCSLAGDCVNQKCVCDAWATGADCSYLNMLPVDPERLGYLDDVHSSWGGTVLYSQADKQWVSRMTARVRRIVFVAF